MIIENNRLATSNKALCRPSNERPAINCQLGRVAACIGPGERPHNALPKSFLIVVVLLTYALQNEDSKAKEVEEVGATEGDPARMLIGRLYQPGYFGK